MISWSRLLSAVFGGVYLVGAVLSREPELIVGVCLGVSLAIFQIWFPEIAGRVYLMAHPTHAPTPSGMIVVIGWVILSVPALLWVFSCLGVWG